MPLWIPPDYGTVAHQLTLTGDPEPMVVTYGIHAPGLVAGQMQALADELHDAYGDVMMPPTANVYTLTQTEVRFDLDADGEGEEAIAISVSNVVGGTSSAPLPQNCALLVDKRTAVPGRKGRGRWYLPGLLREADVDATGLNSTIQTAGRQTNVNDFLTRVENSVPVAKVMVLLHNITDDEPTPTPTTVDQLVVQQKIATRRRRLRR